MIERMIIYSKDVERITGKSSRAARRLLASLKLALGKEPHQYVSVAEFCLVMGLDEDHVRSFMAP